MHGYELGKGQYVRVEDAEREAEANSSIDMREFIAIEKVAPIYFESSYYLVPDKGADKLYRLIAKLFTFRLLITPSMLKICLPRISSTRTIVKCYVIYIYSGFKPYGINI